MNLGVRIIGLKIEILIMDNLPKLYADLQIIYKDNVYWGYYEGNNIFRIGTSENGRNDLFIETSEIDCWKYDNEINNNSLLIDNNNKG